MWITQLSLVLLNVFTLSLVSAVQLVMDSEQRSCDTVMFVIIDIVEEIIVTAELGSSRNFIIVVHFDILESFSYLHPVRLARPQALIPAAAHPASL